MRRGVVMFALAVLVACHGNDEVKRGDCRPGTTPGIRHDTVFGIVDLGTTDLCIECDPGEYCAGGNLRGVPCEGEGWDDDGDPATACAVRTSCSPGTHVVSGGDRVHDRTCAPCDEGTFTRDTNQVACTPWSPTACPPGSQPLQDPTGQACAFCPSGTYCSGGGAPIPCAPGTWDDDGDPSTACIPWSTCQPGQYVTAIDGTTTTDRGCAACPGDTFSTTTMATSCTPRTVCPIDSYAVVAARADTDRQCAPCPDGTHSTATNAATCGDVQELSAGANQTCVVMRDGSVRCWGALHAPRSVAGLLPTTVANSTGLRGVAPGDRHACAVDPNGSALCWGGNDRGQLASSAPIASDVPIAVSLPSERVMQLASTWSETFARAGSGAVYFWGGEGETDALGADMPLAATWPVRELRGVVQLAVFDRYYCGVDYGVGLRCMRADRYVEHFAVPGAVAGAAGDRHACALTNDGRIYCFGVNLPGAISTATYTVAVPGVGGVTALAAGAYHVCVLTGGQVFCWGRNDSAQLGDGTFAQRPYATLVPGLSNVVAIAAGGHHTCALVADGAVWCWGGNEEGQLGDGTTNTRTSPIRTL